MTTDIIMGTAYSTKKQIGIGAVSGAVAGLVMLLVMMVANMQMGFPPLAFQIMIGMMMAHKLTTAMWVGVAGHMLTSTLIGLIFGAVTSTKRLGLTGFGKGIGLGIATGFIAFAVLFLPMLMTVLPPKMLSLMQMMNPTISTYMIMQGMQAALPKIVGSSILVHIVYGLVLGGVATTMVKRGRSFVCGSCNMNFKSKEELKEHAEKRHTQMH